MQMQFNGEIDGNDIQPLLNELKGKGHKAITITVSRWIGDGIDRGGRIDIEIPDDHQLTVNKNKLIALDDEIKTNNKVKNGF